VALSDFAVFSEYAYSGFQEALDYNIDLFNTASAGTIVLRSQSHRGDFSEEAFWLRLQGLIRRRNAYGVAVLSEIAPEMATDVAVKVAAGTPPVRMDPAWYNWIMMNPQLGGVQYGRQLAGDMITDMVETGIMALVAALAVETDVVVDLSADAAGLQIGHFNLAQSKFGDRSNAVRVWIMHSAPMFGLWGQNLANGAMLFNIGNIAIRADPFGRPFIVSDTPALVEPDGGGGGVGTEIPTYYTLGLTTAAIVVDQNDDFTSNVSTTNGNENIRRTVQSEWSFNLSLKGYAWDKTNGGKSPNDAALAVATNWDRIVTSHKDLAGVLIEARAGDPAP
jgi:hypothetical protein